MLIILHYCTDDMICRLTMFQLIDLVPGGEMFEHLIEFGSYSEDDAVSFGVY